MLAVVLVIESDDEMVEKVERLVEPPPIDRSSDAEVGCCFAGRIVMPSVVVVFETGPPLPPLLPPPGVASEPDTDVAIARVVVSRRLSYSFMSKFFAGGCASPPGFSFEGNSGG